MKDEEYKAWVAWHIHHHLGVGNFFLPSEANCELAYCTCVLGVNYRARLKELEKKM